MEGVVREGGFVYVNGELWQRRSADALQPGERVRVEGARRPPPAGPAGVGSRHDRCPDRPRRCPLPAALFFFSAIRIIARVRARRSSSGSAGCCRSRKGRASSSASRSSTSSCSVDLRTITLNIPPQEVITKDNVPVRVNAVAYFRIVAPKDAIVQVENFMVATSQIAQTTLRSVLGQHQLDELLSEREKINAILQGIIDEQTAPWGIKVSIVEVKDVEIPQGMQRAMARQAEAERERRAKVINAEGEFQASERLKDAAVVIADASDRAAAALPADAARARRVAVDDDRLPDADRDARGRSCRGRRQKTIADLRHDPTTGRWVGDRARACRRARARDERAERRRADCPFCAGHEDRTPPETLRLGDGPDRLGRARRAEPLSGARAAGGRDPRPGARALVRRRSPDETLDLVAEAWQRRARDVGAASACRCSTRATKPARRCRTRTRSSRGCLHPRRRGRRARAARARAGARARRPRRRLPASRAACPTSC